VSRLQKGLIAVTGLALVLSLADCWKSTRELQAARQEVRAVTTANEFLKETLGEMTLAMTAKEKEIDRLENAGCGGREKGRPGVPMAPARSKVSKSESETK
jgi:hypothetical protein